MLLIQPLVIIPTYDERENIELLIDAVRRVLPAAHLLIVDDNSPDGTATIVLDRAKRDTAVHLLQRNRKAGLGTAYLSGFRWALQRSYTHVLQMDADFSHDPQVLPVMLEKAQEVDLVLGSRWVPSGSVVGWPFHRYLLSRCANYYAQWVLGVGIRDLTGGFKCFRRATLEALELEEVEAANYGFQIETTWRLLQQGLRVAEIPITFVERQFGRSKLTGNTISEAALLVWRLRSGRVRERG